MKRHIIALSTAAALALPGAAYAQQQILIPELMEPPKPVRNNTIDLENPGQKNRPTHYQTGPQGGQAGNGQQQMPVTRYKPMVRQPPSGTPLSIAPETVFLAQSAVLGKCGEAEEFRILATNAMLQKSEQLAKRDLTRAIAHCLKAEMRDELYKQMLAVSLVSMQATSCRPPAEAACGDPDFEAAATLALGIVPHLSGIYADRLYSSLSRSCEAGRLSARCLASTTRSLDPSVSAADLSGWAAMTSDSRIRSVDGLHDVFLNSSVEIGQAAMTEDQIGMEFDRLAEVLTAFFHHAGQLSEGRRGLAEALAEVEGATGVNINPTGVVDMRRLGFSIRLEVSGLEATAKATLSTPDCSRLVARLAGLPGAKVLVNDIEVTEANAPRVCGPLSTNTFHIALVY